MNKRRDYYQDYLEWELIEPEQEITYLTFETGLYRLNKNCIIKFSRDNQYNITATISGIIENIEEIEPADKLKGSFVNSETITGFSRDGLFKFKLSGAVLGTCNSTYISVTRPSIKFQAELVVGKIEKLFIGYEQETQSIQEWHITGGSEINFPRSTLRSVDKNYQRTRKDTDPENESKVLKSSSVSADHLVVKYAGTGFIVAKVPKEYGPAWAYNICIEYRHSFGRIPDEKEREAISELVGFVFGSQFLKIGQTSYGKSYSIVLQEYQDPWGDNVVSRCQKRGFPPVEIGNYYDYGRAELLINDLIESYLSQRTSLRLKDTLWKYWIAKYSPIGTN